MQGIWPYLIVDDGLAAVDYYQKAFAGKLTAPPFLAEDGKRVLNAQLECFGSYIMVMDAFPEQGDRDVAPATVGHATAMMHVQLDTEAEVDKWFDLSVASGATVTMKVEKQFWGDYYGQVRDPFGHGWSFGMTPKQD